MSETTGSSRVRLPADVELEDRLAFELTARQLAILAVTGLLVLGLYALAGQALPLPVVAAAIAPVVVVGVGLAFGRHAGLSGDRAALAAARFLARPRRRLLAPEGIPAPLSGGPQRPRLAPLDLPVRAVLRSGLVALHNGAFAVVLRASSASFALRSDEEQHALVEAFGRFLNGLTEPVEVCVRSQPVELEARAHALEQAAALVEPALADAARDHADFLRDLAAEGELRRRELLLVFATRARDGSTARTALTRRAAEAIELLHAAAVELVPLDGEEAAALLARTLDPPGPPAGCTLEGVVSGC